MRKVFIVHGFQGEPNGGWRPWLMGELAKLNVYACALPMPTPHEPVREEWMAEIARVVKDSGEEIFLVGHSLGVPAILNYLESVPEKEFAGVFLVAGLHSKLRVNEPDAAIRRADNFFSHPFDFDTIKQRAKKFVVIHGEDDNKVPFSHAEDLSKWLGAELISVPKGKHLSGQDGWYQLPPLLSSLRKEMGQ